MSNNNNLFRFDSEDIQLLRSHLETFLVRIEGDWKDLAIRWGKLKERWNDRQIDEFEPFFDVLSVKYEKLLEEIRQYSLFLQFKINKIEKIPRREYPKIRKVKRDRHGSGEFIRSKVSQLPDDLKGVYYICISDINNLKDSTITYYVGRADDSIKAKLLFHLEKGNNRELGVAIASGQPLIFYWRECIIPLHEEALEIRRLASRGIAIGVSQDNKVLIEKLDFD